MRVAFSGLAEIISEGINAKSGKKNSYNEVKVSTYEFVLMPL